MVTLTEVKDYLRIENTDEDAYIEDLVEMSTDLVERYTGRAMITATYAYTLDGFFSDAIKIPRPPLISVSSVTYIDTDGNSQTLATSVYSVITDSIVGRVELAWSQTWPSTRDQTNAVTITFTAGYGVAATDVPQSSRLAIRMLVGTAYRTRESQVTDKMLDNAIFDRLINANKVVRVH